MIEKASFLLKKLMQIGFWLLPNVPHLPTLIEMASYFQDSDD